MTVVQRVSEMGCGCCKSDEHPSLVSIDEALGPIPAAAAPVRGSERVVLGEAKGRVLAAPVLSRAPLPMLVAALAPTSVDLVSVVRCGDDRDEVRRVLAEAVAGADLLVTSGGVSVGDEDHVKPALRALGAEILFSRVAVNPGKPVSFGRIGSTLWLGLPGNPLSAFLIWTLFGAALVRALAGASDGHPAKRHVTTARGFRRKPGRCELRPAWRVGFDGHGREVVDFDPAVHSARVAGLPGADGILLPSSRRGRLAARGRARRFPSLPDLLRTP